MDGSAEPPIDEAGARRMVVRAVAALIAFVLAAGLAVVLRDADQDADDVVADAGAEPALAGGPPLAGTDVPGYVVRRRAALARMDGKVVAVVSFSQYVDEPEARRLVDGVRVRGLLVAAPGGSPSVVTGGLERWAEEERAAAEQERADLERLAKETDDPAFVAQFQADQARLAGLLGRLDPDGAVVFGVVVEGDVGDLVALSGRTGVRLVDPMARGVDGDELSGLGGLRPEETARAGDPPQRPA
ncbi:MAG TPA: hypothetical protein VM938_01460 [Acidimicrobiales bacterium]|nr:hypothetical protein [Acidimicrobiales bacterium]